MRRLNSRPFPPERTFPPRSWGLVRRGHIAHFIEPMECLPVEKILEGDLWTYELKLDVVTDQMIVSLRLNVL
ncbi:MAG: hypothetical protein QOJ42_8095 [Acidobacteriaceae bacterium]|nr:hypothetical protein [Acidobacteriaceae bacterium]